MRGHVLFGIIILLVILFCTACLKGEQQSIQEPIDLTENNEWNEEKSDKLEETGDNQSSGESVEVQLVNRTLYLLDADGMVVPQVLALPKDSSKAVAKQVLQYLIKDGPVTDLLPSGFRAVIPANTEILGVHIDDQGTIIVDLSDDFLQYDASEERQLIEAMANTVTQFDTVKRMKLRVEGEDITVMPMNGTPIESGVSQHFGINTNLASMPALQSRPVTVYVPKQWESQTYFVPVTTYVEDDDSEIYANVVQSLVHSNQLAKNSLQVFNDGVELIDRPILVDGTLQLNFNKEVLLDEENPAISDDVMEMLTRTLTRFESVQAIEVFVENIKEVKNEQGDLYDAPVTAAYFDAMNRF